MIYKREKNRASTWHVQAHRRRVAEPCARPALLPGRPARQSALPALLARAPETPGRPPATPRRWAWAYVAWPPPLEG